MMKKTQPTKCIKMEGSVETGNKTQEMEFVPEESFKRSLKGLKEGGRPLSRLRQRTRPRAGCASLTSRRRGSYYQRP
ncbi:hypothetical protein IRJ41_001644 [Triplophysa rosa]|uniref:Uncharacterized protein n=1 Tax=Triplophysa rosa TaxID=992332 RepID=A0A9W7WPY4_TRIRA|nr:hypothetical protein IRJ41_001644 [Triplophysa rosa]